MVLVINGNSLTTKILNCLQKSNYDKQEITYSCRSPIPQFSPKTNSSYTKSFPSPTPNMVHKKMRCNNSYSVSQKSSKDDFNFHSSKNKNSHKNSNGLPVFESSKEDLKTNKSNREKVYQKRQDNQFDYTVVSQSSAKSKSHYISQDSFSPNNDYGFNERTHLPKSIWPKSVKQKRPKRSDDVKNDFNFHQSQKENSCQDLNELPVFQPSNDTLKPSQTRLYSKRQNNVRNYS